MFLLILLIAILANGSVLISSLPQYPYNQRGNTNQATFPLGNSGRRQSYSGRGEQAGLASNRPEKLITSATYDQESYAQNPPSFSESGGYNYNQGRDDRDSPGGNLQVECQRQKVSEGQYKFVCEGVQKDLITLRSEHILWLENNGGQQQVLDIEVPNYKIDELIKAGFKTTSVGGSKVNILLKKPEQVYDAEVDVAPAEGSAPSVNLQYEPVDKQVVHFPNDKQYRPLSGPIQEPQTSRLPRQSSKLKRF